MPLDREAAKQRILAVMKSKGLKVDEEGVDSGIIADLFAEFVDYLVTNNQVQVSPGDGQGKFL